MTSIQFVLHRSTIIFSAARTNNKLLAISDYVYPQTPPMCIRRHHIVDPPPLCYPPLCSTTIASIPILLRGMVGKVRGREQCALNDRHPSKYVTQVIQYCRSTQILHISIASNPNTRRTTSLWPLSLLEKSYNRMLRHLYWHSTTLTFTKLPFKAALESESSVQ
jgi:hypothetical protein